MYAPHTITVYNVIHTTDVTTFAETDTAYVTVLEGVFVDASKAVNVRKSGLEGADAVDVYIPVGVKATDGLTGAAKQYAKPMDFWAAANKSGLWTLSFEGNGGETFFIKGRHVITKTVSGSTVIDIDAARLHDDCYNVTKVDEKDYGTPKHWEVGGR